MTFAIVCKSSSVLKNEGKIVSHAFLVCRGRAPARCLPLTHPLGVDMSSPREPPPVNSTSAAAAPPCCQLTAGTELQPLLPQHLPASLWAVLTVTEAARRSFSLLTAFQNVTVAIGFKLIFWKGMRNCRKQKKRIKEFSALKGWLNHWMEKLRNRNATMQCL